MAAMKRERQWDMFDVVTGACPLDDYLNQRYSENDLQSKLWVEPSDRVDELRPPPKGTKEQVVIPIQGPGISPPKPAQDSPTEPLPSRPPWESAPAQPLPSRPPWEAAPPALPVSARPAPPAPSSPPAPPAPASVSPTNSFAPLPSAPPPAPPAQVAVTAPSEQPLADPPEEPRGPVSPSMAELLAQFHQAAKAYEERAKDEVPDSEGEPSQE